MNTLAIVLLSANLVLLIALIAIVLLRTRGAVPGGSGQPGELRAVGGELRQEFAAQRAELAQSLAMGQQQLDTLIRATSGAQAQELARERESRDAAQRAQGELLERSLVGLSDRIHAGAKTSAESHAELKSSVESRFDELRAANDAKLEQVRVTVGEKLQSSLKTSLDENAQRMQTLTETHVQKQEELQRTLREELEKLRQGNEAKLEKMRETVDEKLQGTLERRLGESFKLVSDRLEQVQKGLGEMQSLASDVGGLKRVLTNVKTRGSWGEVQLSRQLEDLLTPEQYEENVVIRPGSRDSVEFAVKLPGRGEDEKPVYLPIDSKFPQEDYERLLEAQEAGEREAVEAATKTLERVILAQAKLISEKYISPPQSTDFAIMYLPTEGLFAEAIRRPGLASRLQSEQRVLITGPTTLASLLNSLQMGFRTLAIERRSSEVWQVLSAAKLEFQKYGRVWEKLEKQLQTAQNTVQQAGVRTRAVERRLRAVETLDTGGQQGVLDDVLADMAELDAEAEAETNRASSPSAESSAVSGAAEAAPNGELDELWGDTERHAE
ncbi:DNA recombination protein RmuC [Leucobacter sp. CSA2]|uniref:DNA recombination protein RmuC n=1 Tax=Leucobacter edaphi TaxID=2796472 RepID=A0A934QET3_9MICO|nr:DNA recombination protein RmuC [Leucobacter edaphi]MBK0422650.1 DNA recombination protein RmuC [Leucobacter edaphi]